MLKSDRWIKFQAKQGMISPFEENQVSKCGVLSYGVSSYGYDLRLADELKIATNMNGSVIDPKRFDKRNFHDVKSKTNDGETFFTLPPNSFALGRSIEYFNIPRNICVQCVGKSTYARCGIVVPATPLEPEWSGNVTLEFVNTTSLSVLLYVGEGVCQCLFFEGEECDQSYKDRGGKYQGQTGITLPR